MPNETQRATPVYTADLEDLLRRIRKELAEGMTSVRRVRPDSLESRLRDAGLLGEFAEWCAVGMTAPEIQARLREHGIEVNYWPIIHLRRKLLGRKLARETLEELDRMDVLLNPLARYAELYARLEERYRAHVEMEKTLGVPMNEDAARILGLMRDVLRDIMAAGERLRLWDGPQVRVKADVQVQADNAEAFVAAVWEALKRAGQGDAGGPSEGGS